MFGYPNPPFRAIFHWLQIDMMPRPQTPFHTPAQALPMRFPPNLEVKVAGHARSKKGHSSLKKSLITCASALSLLITGPLASAASGIVVLGGDTGVGVSSVIGMSNDGDVMVGNGSPGYVTADQSRRRLELSRSGSHLGYSSFQPFRWTAETGLAYLGSLGGNFLNIANDVSSDGAVVVGRSEVVEFSEARKPSGSSRAFRWTSDGMINLGTLGDSRGRSSANGVNADGSVVVGYSSTSGLWHDKAFRWTLSDGMKSLGTLDKAIYSVATSVNARGDVVVGRSGDHGWSRAFRWTSAGMVDLGTLADNDAYSEAHDVNDTGDVVVGRSGPAIGTLEVGQAFRWTKDTGMVGLGTLPGDTASVATSVNGRGDVMVGVSISSDGERRGFRWTQATGMQTIEQWLKDNGVDVKGLPRVVTATAVNGAGNVVFGSLADGRGAYIARVEGPSRRRDQRRP
ncbi:hypothetical protein D8B34_02480 [Verminephrobacter eiseniae]|nr:hypothetical protein [Verminephrobacter eiseniae]MCW8183167.1 hypothetical protein [Verminephrobacter eiseniae]MCW8222108.1 hypothetical protein [Verminephrobacter eiseniae]MCW8232702.1 hypothetical protein [Verminephrobacter eiseniae]